MINRSATIVWNASPRLLVQRNMLVYSLLSSAISVSLHCLRIWIKLCWISRCSENLSGPARPRRACSKWASFKHNISHSTEQNKKNARTQEEKSGQTALKLLFPEPPIWNKIAILTEHFTPCYFWAPGLGLTIQTCQREETKQTDRRCAASWKITANQALRFASLTIKFLLSPWVVCPSFWW